MRIKVTEKVSLELNFETGKNKMVGGKKDGTSLSDSVLSSLLDGEVKGISLSEENGMKIKTFLAKTKDIRAGVNRDVKFSKDSSDFIYTRSQDNSGNDDVSYWKHFINSLSSKWYQKLCDLSTPVGSREREWDEDMQIVYPTFLVTAQELKKFKLGYETYTKQVKEEKEEAKHWTRENVKENFRDAKPEVREAVFYHNGYGNTLGLLEEAGAIKKINKVSFDDEEERGDFNYSTGYRIVEEETKKTEKEETPKEMLETFDTSLSQLSKESGISYQTLNSRMRAKPDYFKEWLIGHVLKQRGVEMKKILSLLPKKE